MKTLDQAQKETLASLLAGEMVACPCCRQQVKLYPRSINSGMAAAFLAFYREYGEGAYEYAPNIVNKYTNEFAQLRWWKLIEAEDFASHNGIWRVTPRGGRFARKEILLPKYKLRYNRRTYKYEGENPKVSVVDCLRNKFDYDELMGTPIRGK